MPDDDKMDVPAVLQKLDVALGLQYRSAIEQTVVAAGLVGVEWQTLETLLWSFATEELADARRMAQKVVALGGEPSTTPAGFELASSPVESLRQLIAHECEALAAFHAVIPDTGQEPRSEALEHRLEHLIMRKQEQVDTLRRIVGDLGE